MMVIYVFLKIALANHPSIYHPGVFLRAGLTVVDSLVCSITGRVWAKFHISSPIANQKTYTHYKYG